MQERFEMTELTDNILQIEVNGAELVSVEI
jgi:hypothetical protein